MSGTVSTEIEVGVPASEAWKVYGTLLLDDILAKELPHMLHKYDVLEGDGGAGTVINVTFPPGGPPPFNTSYKEKYVVVDDEKRIKVTQVVEGFVLDHGFTFFQVHFEVIEKDETTCIFKITIEYKVKEEGAAGVLPVIVSAFETLMEVGAKYLTQQKDGQQKDGQC